MYVLYYSINESDNEKANSVREKKTCGTISTRFLIMNGENEFGLSQNFETKALYVPH